MEVLGLRHHHQRRYDHLEATGQPSHQEVVEAGAAIVPWLQKCVPLGRPYANRRHYCRGIKLEPCNY